jgi:site-specific recombinase XerD
MEDTTMLYLETAELLKVLTEANKRGAREALMFCLAYRHGLRASEIARLTVDDVQNGSIDIRRLKGSEHTIQPLYEHEIPVLNEVKLLAKYLRERGDADGSRVLFISRQGSGLSRQQIYNLFADCALAAGIEAGRRNVHILKHSLASHLIRNGASVAYVQQLLGHKDAKSTLCYTHITQKEAAVVANKVMGSIFA